MNWVKKNTSGKHTSEYKQPSYGITAGRPISEGIIANIIPKIYASKPSRSRAVNKCQIILAQDSADSENEEAHLVRRFEIEPTVIVR
jgi:hypothetical protein